MSIALGTAPVLSVGSRDHYAHAVQLLEASPQRVVLMQRSSTFVLGPEDGWDMEAHFFEKAWSSIAAGASWFHIASTDGIARHLLRATSNFPNLCAARERLDLDGDTVSLPAPGNATAKRSLPIKNIDRLAPRPDLKVDRQARILAVDYGGDHRALVVENIGDLQVTLQLGDPAAGELFDLVLRLWHECPAYLIDDIPTR
jgi:hypothetical protein